MWLPVQAEIWSFHFQARNSRRFNIWKWSLLAGSTLLDIHVRFNMNVRVSLHSGDLWWWLCVLCDNCRFVSGTNISIPTHYFAVLTSCRDSALAVSACVGELQTVSFLLPHRPNNSESCKVRNDAVGMNLSVASESLLQSFPLAGLEQSSSVVLQ